MCLGTIFFVGTYLLQVARPTVTSVASVHMFFLPLSSLFVRFPPTKCPCGKTYFTAPLELNPPPFLVKWNPGLDRHICGWLQSSVEKWSQKIFLLAALTSENRDTWASMRHALETIPGNEEVLKLIDSAIFVLCLDDHEVNSIADVTRTFLHGDGKNR